MRKLLIRDFLPRGTFIHFGRTTVQGELPLGPHTHDFYEFFSVDAGSGWHFINGQKIELRAGHIVFLRDRDLHGFSGNGLVTANAAFARSTFKHIANRYFSGKPDFYNERSRMPCMQLLDPVRLEWLKSRMDRLASSSKDALETDLFLLEVFQKISGATASGTATTGAAPAWVGRICEAAKRPEVFTRGTPALAELAGRTPEHISRELKRWTGKLPSDWITEARLQFAAQRLTTTAATILEISLECGYESLGHFYSVFNKRFGISPRKYRLQARRIAGL